MTGYRLQHIPTGLYFCNSKKFKNKNITFSYLKTNLDKFGRIYSKKPTDIQLQLWLSGFWNKDGFLVRVNKKDILKVWKSYRGGVMKKQKEVKFRKDKKFRFKDIPLELHVTNDGFTLWVTDSNGNTSHWLLDASCLIDSKYINLGNTNTRNIDTILFKIDNSGNEKKLNGNFKIKIKGI